MTWFGVLPARHSLSWRLLWFTLAVMLGTEILLFLPAMVRERRDWLEARMTASLLAVQAQPALTAPRLPPQGMAPQGMLPALALERAAREELLRLAGVVSIRLQEPGRPMVVLAAIGQVQAPALLDLRHESSWGGLVATLAALARSGDRLLLVMSAGPKRPGAVLSVVLHDGDLGTHLRTAAQGVALKGLALAGAVGLLVHVSLLFLLVRPMRRLTGSIAAFRADPEHVARLGDGDTPAARRDEIAIAAEELAALQREMRAALWRNARLAALGTAVAKVSHDLRGILSPAMLTAERLLTSEDAMVRRSGETLMRTVEQATDLMKTTLDFAREVPAVPRRERVGLRALVDEAAEQARAVRGACSVENGVGDAVDVLADRIHLLRCLGNLLRNAAEAGAQRIFVAASVRADGVAVTVADDGPGLPEPVLRQLFRPFVTGGRAGGTGLGLAITRDLLRADGGDIALVHSGRGGTEFRLTLPLPPASGPPARELAAGGGV